MLLVHGDVTSIAQLELRGEAFALQARIVLERESLAAGRTARAIVRLSLTVGGAPASIALLARAMWDVTLTDRHGVAVTKSQPLIASDGDASVLEWPMGDDTASVALAVHGVVTIVSEQRELELWDRETFEVATMQRAVATEALYLARTAAGWAISALGKTGEARARRPVTIGLRHIWSRVVLAVELATDDAGRVELGALDGVDRITATLGGVACAWDVADRGARVPPIVRPSRRRARAGAAGYARCGGDDRADVAGRDARRAAVAPRRGRSCRSRARSRSRRCRRKTTRCARPGSARSRSRSSLEPQHHPTVRPATRRARSSAACRSARRS